MRVALCGSVGYDSVSEIERSLAQIPEMADSTFGPLNKAIKPHTLQGLSDPTFKLYDTLGRSVC